MHCCGMTSLSCIYSPKEITVLMNLGNIAPQSIAGRIYNATIYVLSIHAIVCLLFSQ